MILVFLTIGIILLVIGCIFENKDIYSEFSGCAVVSGSVTIVVSLIGIICFLITLSIGATTLDEKIAMYEAENTAIEEEINTLVENYMRYESDTYESLKGESGITLISLYPELKADTLVSQQCELYISNKEHITALKEEKIEMSLCKFMLYFGK